MDKLRDIYEAAGQAAIDKVKFTDDVSFEVAMGLVPDMNNGGELKPGWWLALQLKHNVLLGKPPIADGRAVPYPVPPAEFIAQMATQMLESARQQRDKLTAEPVAAQGLPAGLTGRKL